MVYWIYIFVICGCWWKHWKEIGNFCSYDKMVVQCIDREWYITIQSIHSEKEISMERSTKLLTSWRKHNYNLKWIHINNIGWLAIRKEFACCWCDLLHMILAYHCCWQLLISNNLRGLSNIDWLAIGEEFSS